MNKHFLKKYVYLTVGTFSVLLGVIGIVLPFLPTTPFLLLASYCFLRSSHRFYDWLIHHPILGRYLYDYLTYGAIKLKTKFMAIVMIWLSLLFCILWTKHLHLRLLLAMIGIFVSLYIASRKTLTKDQP